jgi:hypothetical protein
MAHSANNRTVGRSGSIQFWVVCAWFLLFTLLFFGQATLHSQMLAPVDAACAVDVVWNEACGDVNQPHNRLIASDQATQFYPWRVLTRQLISEGYLPLWNPYSYSGYPLLANAQSAVLYPINLLTLLVPITHAFALRAVLCLWLASVGTYVLARQLQVSVYGAMLAGISFGFSSPLVVYVGYALVEVVVLLPWLFYVSERLISRPKPGWLIAVAVVLGAMGLGGHPETLVMVILVWVTYVMVRLVMKRWLDRCPWSAIWRRVLLFACASALGCGVAAVQLSPSWEMLHTSHGYAARSVNHIVSPLEAVTHPGELVSLVLLLWPNLFGNPSWPASTAYHIELTHSNFVERAAYVGILPLLLLPAAFVGHLNRQVAGVFATVAIVCLGFLLRAPMFGFITSLPLLETMDFGRFRLPLMLVLAILAGLGLDSFLQSRYPRRLHAIIAFGLAVLLTISIGQMGLSLAIGGARIAPHVEDIWRALQSSLSPDMLSKLTLEVSRLTVTATYMVVPLALSVVLLAFGLLRRPTVWLVAPLLTLVTAFDLYIAGSGFNSAVDPQLEARALASRSPTMAFLEHTMQPTDRVVALGIALLPNSSAILGVSDVRGYDPMVSERYYQVFATMPGFHEFGPGGFFLTAVNKALRILSTTHVVSTSEIAGMQPIFSSGSGVLVYRIADALPRAYLVDRYRVLPPDAVLGEINREDWDPSSTALIETDPPTWWTAPSKVAAGPSQDSVEVLEYEPDRVTIEVSASKRSLLVLADGYDVGWRAYVDDEAQPVYPVNYIVRGVFVESGNHRVEFVYRPVSFLIGATVSSLSILILVAAAVVNLIR